MLRFVDMTSSKATVTHVIPGRDRVGGVTSLGNDVFVMRCNSRQIEVYDAVTFTLQRCLTVLQFGFQHYGLAVCPSNKCLYASDCGNNKVHRVELTGSNAVMQWSVARWPTGLTVNRAQHLIVVSRIENKLQEFTTHGTLLQNINLPPGIGCPWCVIDTTSGQYVVSYRRRRTSDGVYLVDMKGAVIHKYGVGLQKGSEVSDGQRSYQVMKMSDPAGLAIDKHGNILVANTSNHRLLVFDHSLSSAHEMFVSVDRGLAGPFALWYDKSRDRLYIGEWSGGRVIIIDHLKDFTTSRV